jgi:transcriptional regulator with XRE-family HTH domain
VNQAKRVQQGFGKAVKKFRKTAGYSQEELADQSKVHRTYMGSVERGERNISLMNMWRISNALKIKLSELVHEMEKHLNK